MPSVQAVRWMFTINNYTEEQVDFISTLVPDVVRYLVFGREVAPTTLTPHLQGYLELPARKTMLQVRALLGSCGHLEQSKGLPKQAIAYCKKDGSWSEFGLQQECGKRNDWHEFRDWLKTLEVPPTDLDILERAPHLWVRHKAQIYEMIRRLVPLPPLVTGDPRAWQLALGGILDEPPNDRSIHFVVDYKGCCGKTWFQKWYFSKRPDQVQLLPMGKRDDMAYCVDETKSVFFVNVPRGSIEFLQYSVLEMLKDRMVASQKYESRMKILKSNAHVVVFTNEQPDIGKLTSDRIVMFQHDDIPRPPAMLIVV